MSSASSSRPSDDQSVPEEEIVSSSHEQLEFADESCSDSDASESSGSGAGLESDLAGPTPAPPSLNLATPAIIEMGSDGVLQRANFRGLIEVMIFPHPRTCSSFRIFVLISNCVAMPP